MSKTFYHHDGHHTYQCLYYQESPDHLRIRPCFFFRQIFSDMIMDWCPDLFHEFRFFDLEYTFFYTKDRKFEKSQTSVYYHYKYKRYEEQGSMTL